ncbi:MAG TPA: DUF6620 family protein [Polyangiaceae bacterium]
MGFFDSVKKMLGNSTEAAPPPEPVEEETSSDEDEGEQYDLAGFDPDDEEAFFAALQQIESVGTIAGDVSEESRARAFAQYGIRDHLHWQTVKESMYQALTRKHGSFDVAFQRQQNWMTGQSQKWIEGNVAAKAATGELNPVEGISLESWAALNASISQGANFEDLLKGAGIDRARWDRASAEWLARMSRDTTFAISTVYGNAFTAASQGKFSHLAKEAMAARASNSELKSQPPMSIEQYYEVMFDQSYAVAQGKSATDALKAYGLSIVDFCDLSLFMGYHFQRNSVAQIKQHQDAMESAEKKAKAKYPGVTADVDISF